MKKACIIYCIEKGPLEKQTLLSISTLKEFGDAFSVFDIFCVQPRKEFPVSKITKRKLEALKVNFVDEPVNARFRYYRLANKPLSCEYIFRNYQYEHYIFFDSDTLIINEPSLLISEDYDISLHPVYKKGVGIKYTDDKNYSYWKNILNIAGGNIEYVTEKITTLDGEVIFPYWNSGVISAKRACSVYLHWADLFRYIMEKRIFPPEGIYFTEQSALTAAVLANDFNVQHIPTEYNYPVGNAFLQKYSELFEKDSLKILHHLNNINWLFRQSIIKQTTPKIEFILKEINECGIDRRNIFDILNSLKQKLKERLFYIKSLY